MDHSEPDWDLGNRNRIVAIGDIHGDLDALVRILLGLGLADDTGRWAGGSTDLVLIGDLNDRGPDSVNTIAFVMGLENEAALHGGAVHTLLGNHELFAVQGDYRYVRSTEVLALEHFWYDDLNGLHAVYRGNSPFAKWIRRRPTILKSGPIVFVHAGLGEWIVGLPPDVLNTLLQSWVAHFQGVAEQPDENTYWLTSQEGGGPLWTSKFQVGAQVDSNSSKLRSDVGEWLRLLGTEHLVIGHKPTKAIDYEIAFPHPTFGERVIGIDTGISRFYGGRLSALEIRGAHIRAHYFDRGEGDLSLTRTLRATYHRERESMSGGTSSDI